jgi:hypothetical protein
MELHETAQSERLSRGSWRELVVFDELYWEPTGGETCGRVPLGDWGMPRPERRPVIASRWVTIWAITG